MKISIFHTITLILLFSVKFLTGQNQEDFIKAAFIEKFTNLIEWPEHILKDSSNEDHFIIYVAGNKNLCETIQSSYRNRTLKNKPVKVICSKSIEPETIANIIYIAENDFSLYYDAVEAFRNHPCLIISEFKGFAEKGVHINFYITKEQTMHFEMNKTSLDTAGFKPDFLLLEFARVVESK